MEVKIDTALLLQQSFELIQKDFGLAEDGGAGDRIIQSEDQLLHFLTKKINQMIDSDMNSLLNALYRIDIPEQTTKKILYSEAHENIAHQLAKAIIQREQQKVVTRLQHRFS